MGGEWDPQDELSNALNEIRKNEKEMSMIATVAQTLIERTAELQAVVSEQQMRINQQSTTETSAVANYSALQE